jgi:hypothetical protein
MLKTALEITSGALFVGVTGMGETQAAAVNGGQIPQQVVK